MKLLLVEDNPEMQTTLQRALRASGMQVVACTDGDRALDRWRQDLLVLQGWWPIRFTWRQARERPEWCADVVGRKLAGVENDRT